MVADHCHTSGYVREIICERCNSWLGVVEKNRSNVNSYLDRLKRKTGISPHCFTGYLLKYDWMKNIQPEDKTSSKPIIVVEI